jgi:phosphosulfolactate phosphohydrolase-like enzyme
MRLHDSALLALSLFERYSAHDAFRLSSTWSRLSKTKHGADDLEHCARINVSTLVPQVAYEAGRLFVRNEKEV